MNKIILALAVFASAMAIANACGVCLNGSEWKKRKCICKEGFAGERCGKSTVLGPCEPNPCKNNGKCKKNKDGSTFCKCKEHTRGMRCGIHDLDPSYTEKLVTNKVCIQERFSQKMRKDDKYYLYKSTHEAAKQKWRGFRDKLYQKLDELKAKQWKDDLVTDLKKEESFEKFVYLDSYGHKTIGYGTLLQKTDGTKHNGELFTKYPIIRDKKKMTHADALNKKFELTEPEALIWLKAVMEEKISQVESRFPGMFPFLLPETKRALVDTAYRGDFLDSPCMRKYMKLGLWKDAATEYINHKEYKKCKIPANNCRGVVTRMDKNKAVFEKQCF